MKNWHTHTLRQTGARKRQTHIQIHKLTQTNKVHSGTYSYTHIYTNIPPLQKLIIHTHTHTPKHAHKTCSHICNGNRHAHVCICLHTQTLVMMKQAYRQDVYLLLLCFQSALSKCVRINTVHMAGEWSILTTESRQRSATIISSFGGASTARYRDG